MSSGLSRRDFLRRTAVTGAGVMIVGASEVLLSAPNGLAAPRAIGYGALLPDPARRLALPEGFRYTIVTEAGKTSLDSGEPTPSNHDCTGAFRAGGGGTVLVNNHELRDRRPATPFPVPLISGFVYDPTAQRRECQPCKRQLL